MLRSICRLLLVAVVVALFGCGGGGGGGTTPAPPPTKAIVKVATSGTLPAGTLIGGIQATLTYPTTKGLSISESNVVLSGVGAGLFAPNVNTPGQVAFGQVTVQPGIPTGEFATATFSIAAGNTQVLTSDFAIAAGSNVIDTNGTTLPGISVVVQSVTLQ